MTVLPSRNPSTRVGVVAVAVVLGIAVLPASADQQPSGTIATIAGDGRPGFDGDGGLATEAAFTNPTAVVVAQDGTIYVSDTGNQRVRRIDAGTGVVTTIAGTGHLGYNGDNRLATKAHLANPRGLAIDAAGDLLIAEAGGNRIRRVDLETGIITTVAGTGVKGFGGDNGTAAAADLNDPTDVILAINGDLLVADHYNYRIRRIDVATGAIRTVAGDGRWGYFGDGGKATETSLFYPDSVAEDFEGNLYVADHYNHRIRRIDADTQIVTTAVGVGIWPSTADGRYAPMGVPTALNGDGGPGSTAVLAGPIGVVTDPAGNVYIADTANHRIRRLDRVTGIVTTVAGNGFSGFSGDGGPATGASITSPYGVTFDTQGNMYIADAGNNRIRRVVGVLSAP